MFKKYYICIVNILIGNVEQSVEGRGNELISKSIVGESKEFNKLYQWNLFILFFSLKRFMCTVCTCVWDELMSMELSRDQKRSRLLCSWSDRPTGICEPPDARPGNWTLEVQQALSTAELLLLPIFTHFHGRRKPWASPTQNRLEASPLSVLGLPFTICTAVCNQHWTRVIWSFEIDTKNECPLVAVPASTKPFTNTLARCKMTFKICFLRKEKSHSRLTAKNLQLKLP